MDFEKMDVGVIVKNIVKEIMKKCDENQIIVDIKFVTFYVDLLIIDPNWGISEKIMEIRSDLQKFIQFVVANLKKPDQPNMVALKIQFNMETHFEVMEQTTSEHRKYRENMLNALKVSVLEPSFNDRYNISGLLDKIVFYITLASGLGNPYEKAVYREVETVFKSVCNDSELRDFINCFYTIRVERLNTFVNVVSGIRLYNRDCQRGGQGIQDLPKLLFRAIEAVKHHLNGVITKTRKITTTLVRVIQSYYQYKEINGNITLDVDIPKWATPQDLEYCKGVLAVYEQYHEAIGKLIAEIEKIKKAALIIEMNQEELLEFLHRRVISNMHLPISFVFFSGYCPWFMVLTKGTLAKGNDDYGIAQYKRCFYVFSSPIGVQYFLKDPEYYINHVLNLCRKKCELILHLRVKNHLIKVRNQKKLVEYEEIHKETKEQGTYIESYMPPPISKYSKYDSNVWDLRRKAWQMAYLKNCKTSSTQTERSFSKNCNPTQTYMPKETSVQTTVDNYSETPTPLGFFYGLRGRKDAQQLLLDLTYGEFK
ncbi:cilia- and flagella-associated protein 206 isoform X2 [Leptinotarsa decemlineata]|uniref:cilia- and flagella-associated protein 206 isoform X2 n=1 Tax=Leptinotarsa decemlineata TaxID=7539 RepID=UPI003D309F79